MKKFITFFFALSVVVYLSGMTTYAQGKGRGPGAGASQNRAPAGNQGKVKPVPKPGTEAKKEAKEQKKEAKEAKKEEKEDQKIVEHIDRNPQLKARVDSLLPAGMSLKTAAMGFRNQGEFLAALHVSKNLDIPFAQLKSKLTGDHAVPLGKAIQELRPNLTEKQAKAEAEKAEKQAKETGKPKAKPPIT